MEIVAFCEARLIATVADLADALSLAHGKASFDELRVGPLLRQPLIGRLFLPSVELRAVPAVRLEDVVRDLSEYRRERGYREKIELSAFLNWAAARRGLTSPRELGVRLKPAAIGTLIKGFGAAGGPERALRDKAVATVTRELSNELEAACRDELDAAAAAHEADAREGRALTEGARSVLLRFRGGVVQGPRVLAKAISTWACGDDEQHGAVAGETAAQKRRKKAVATPAPARVLNLAELAASLCCAGAQGVDADAIRSALAESAGLSESDLAQEIARIADQVAAAHGASDEPPSLLRCLALVEGKFLEHLRLPDFGLLEHGTFLAFAASTSDHHTAWLRRLGANATVQTDDDVFSAEEGGSGYAVEEKDALNALGVAAEQIDFAGSDGLQRVAGLEAAFCEHAGHFSTLGLGTSFVTWLSGALALDNPLRLSLLAGGSAVCFSEVAVVMNQILSSLGLDTTTALDVHAERLSLTLCSSFNVSAVPELGFGDLALVLARCARVSQPADTSDTRHCFVSAAAFVFAPSGDDCEDDGGGGPPAPTKIRRVVLPTDAERARLVQALAHAPLLADLDTWLMWTAGGFALRYGPLRSFIGSVRAHELAAAGSTHELLVLEQRSGGALVLLDASSESVQVARLQAAAAQGDAHTAVVHHLSLLARAGGDGVRFPTALVEDAWRNGLLRHQGAGGDATVLAAQSLAAVPEWPPLRLRVARVVVAALADGVLKRGERAEATLMAAATSDNDKCVLHEIAMSAEAQADATSAFPLWLADFWRQRLDAKSSDAVPSESHSQEERSDEPLTKDTSTSDGTGNGPSDDDYAPQPTPDDDSLGEDTASEDADGAEDQTGDETPAQVLASIRDDYHLGAEGGLMPATNKLHQALDNSLKILARDLYSEDTHFLLELIQVCLAMGVSPRVTHRCLQGLTLPFLFPIFCLSRTLMTMHTHRTCFPVSSLTRHHA
jgi:hypothetical protein